MGSQGNPQTDPTATKYRIQYEKPRFQLILSIMWTSSIQHVDQRGPEVV